MTALQKTIVAATIATLAGVGVYEAHQASQLRDQVRALEQTQQQFNQQSEQLAELQHRLTQCDQLQAENERLRKTVAELPRLRGEVTRLRAVESQLAQLKATDPANQDPFTKSVVGLAAQAARLNQQFEARPQLRIPEMSLLKEADWIEAGRTAELDTEAGVREAMMQLRSKAKQNSYDLWQTALKSYLDNHNGQLPDGVAQLKSYFNPPLDDSILARYQMLRTGNIADGPVETWIVGESSPVDQSYDMQMRMGLGSLEIARVGPQPIR